MRYIETKTILSKLRTADRWFGIAYNMNLYRGCQHGCIYCDTRSDCYGIGDIAQIAVKRNALELLPAELRARRKKRATIGTGSMNDPYMPVERELRLTRRALGMIADERFPVHVITKSSLAERDADILQEISRHLRGGEFHRDLCRRRAQRPHGTRRPGLFGAVPRDGGTGCQGHLYGCHDDAAAAADQRHAGKCRSHRPPGEGRGGVVYPPDVRRDAPQRVEGAFPCRPGARVPGLKARYEACFGNRYECFGPNCRALDDTFRNLCAKLGIATRMEFYRPASAQQQTLF